MPAVPRPRLLPSSPLPVARRPRLPSPPPAAPSGGARWRRAQGGRAQRSGRGRRSPLPSRAGGRRRSSGRRSRWGLRDRRLPRGGAGRSEATEVSEVGGRGAASLSRAGRRRPEGEGAPQGRGPRPAGLLRRRREVPLTAGGGRGQRPRASSPAASERTPSARRAPILGRPCHPGFASCRRAVSVVVVVVICSALRGLTASLGLSLRVYLLLKVRPERPRAVPGCRV